MCRLPSVLFSRSSRLPPGFAVRPFGALIFGRLGDMIGRKYTFLITMSLMGIGTFFIGVLPGFAPGVFWRRSC